MDFLEWAKSPWGQNVPHPHRLVLDMGCGHRRISLFHRARYLSAIFRQSQGVREQWFAFDCGAHTGARTETFADRAAVSLGYGGFHVHAPVYRLPPEGGYSDSTGSPITGSQGPFSPFPYSFISFTPPSSWTSGPSGLTGLTRGTPDRRILRFMGKSAPPPDKFAKYPLENKLYHGAIVAAGLSAIVTGVFMMFRVRTIFFPRNPYLFGDLTWGMMYVLHGLAGVGLIALIMVHVYFGLRPEKRAITKSMIFGWMSRDFYLEEHDPRRWPVETPPSSPASADVGPEGLRDAG